MEYCPILPFTIAGLQGEVESNRIVGSIETWGPQYRIRLDLNIRSLSPGNKGWSSILRFNRKGAGNLGTDGERIPNIEFYHGAGGRLIKVHNGQMGYFNKIPVETNKWYNIQLEQKMANGKVQIKKIYLQ